MVDQGQSALPVVHQGVIIGVLRQEDLLHASQDGLSDTTPISEILTPDFPVILATESGSSALRMFAELNPVILAVVGKNQEYYGIVTIPALLSNHNRASRLYQVGGMATPFGVYLTDGTHYGGAKPWMLAVTGAVLFLLIAASTLVMGKVDPFITKLPVAVGIQDFISGALGLILFLSFMRLIPLAGIHAAEHMTVHALERGEPLSPEVVGRMPRVHPRCGTNLAAGASLFLGISQSHWLGDSELQLLVAILVTVSFWKRLGSFLQEFFTTRPPTPKQLQMGIAAANDLIQKHYNDPQPPPTPMRRILFSGMLQVMAGAASVAILTTWLANFFPILRTIVR